MKQLNSKNSTIAYKVEGRGFPVVLIHGFCEDSRMWDDFKIDLIEEKFKVITIDLPGFGLSSPAENPSIDEYAKAVLRVLDHLNIKACIVIGHSMGGYTALALADIRPDILRGLGLFHSHPFTDSDEKKEARAKEIKFIQNHGHPLYVKQLFPRFFPKRHTLSSPFDLDKLIHRAARFPEQGIIGALTAMTNRSNKSDVLRQINCPVLFIIGQKDDVIPIELSLKQLPLPAVSSIHIMKGVGHMAMLESKRPAQLIVRKFIDYCLT